MIFAIRSISANLYTDFDAADCIKILTFQLVEIYMLKYCYYFNFLKIKKFTNYNCINYIIIMTSVFIFFKFQVQNYKSLYTDTVEFLSEAWNVVFETESCYLHFVVWNNFINKTKINRQFVDNSGLKCEQRTHIY